MRKFQDVLQKVDTVYTDATPHKHYTLSDSDCANYNEDSQEAIYKKWLVISPLQVELDKPTTNNMCGNTVTGLPFFFNPPSKLFQIQKLY